MTINWVDAGIPANERTYTRMRSTWPRRPRIQVAIHGASEPIRLPLEFVQASGDNTWRLVQRMLGLLVNEAGLLQTTAGESLILDAQPQAGEYIFVPLNGAPFSWKQGPSGFRKDRAIVEGEREERSSISACSTDQTRFRENIISRDVWCLLTKKGTNTQAAHIVPKRRIDIYSQVLDDVDVNPFERSMGILLSRDMHAAYDQWEWSLFWKAGIYYVHVFDPTPELRDFHGLEIGPNRFNHLLPVEDHPDPRLCNWHWEQCVLMRLRGFSAGMAANAM